MPPHILKQFEEKFYGGENEKYQIHCRNHNKVASINEVQDFLSSLYTQAVEEERKRIEGVLTEIAEPYDGAKWHNNLSLKQVLLALKDTPLSGKE